jgi:hypothetical protein
MILAMSVRNKQAGGDDGTSLKSCHGTFIFTLGLHLYVFMTSIDNVC